MKQLKANTQKHHDST